MAKVELCRMTWREAEERFRANPVVLLPSGSVEQHGPHVPVGDYRYATEVARRIAERTGAIVAPTIPWGYSEHFRPFPGTLSVRPETLALLLEDLCDGFLRFGLDHLLFLCCHKGNMPILEQVGRRLRETHRLRVATIEPWSWMTPAFRKDAYGSEKASLGHGSDPMGSLAMALYPEDVRRDLLELGGAPEFAGVPFKSSSQVDIDGVPAFVYMDYDEVTRNGVMGDPRLSSPEIGKKVLDHVVQIGVHFVEMFAKMPTRIEGSGPRRVEKGS
jgi:creatinine amidohydrolase